MAGPIAMMRLMITSPRFLEEPLRFFVVATRFDWEEEAKLASELTPTLAIVHDEEYQTILERISSRHLLSPRGRLHQKLPCYYNYRPSNTSQSFETCSRVLSSRHPRLSHFSIVYCRLNKSCRANFVAMPTTI